jgi:fructose-bisphosphate aldolase class I
MTYNNLNPSLQSMLKTNAEFIVQQGKGILAADENPSSIIKRFNSIGVDNTAEQRRIYRQLLFTTPDIQQYISGVIMHEETFNQSNDSSVPFPMMLTRIGILPGIKLDRVLISNDVIIFIIIEFLLL